MSKNRTQPKQANGLRMFANVTDITPHDPSRYESSDGLDNPQCTNGERVSSAWVALDCFQKARGMEETFDTASADLICDLLHLIHSRDVDPFDVIGHGIEHFLCEAGEPHPYDETRKTRLHLAHIVDKSQGGKDEASNLRALCSVCNEGASNLTLDRPSISKLLIQVRRAKREDQLEVLRWLKEKYGE